MKKVDIEKIFNKLSLQVRSTGHNYGWLTVSDKKNLRKLGTAPFFPAFWKMGRCP